MSTNQAAKSSSVSPVPIDEKYRSLLNPIPRPGLRMIMIIIVAVTIIVWSFIGSNIHLEDAVKGISGAVNFVKGLFPIEFEMTPTTTTIGSSMLTFDIPTVIEPIVQTVQMALLGTIGAVVCSLPVSLLAARNVSPHPVIYLITRFILNFARAIPIIIYALIFVDLVGLNPFAGILGLTFGSIGSLSRHYAESIEAIDPAQVMAVRATGANQAQVFSFAVIPQALPLMLSYSLTLFEYNVSAATILGIVGAGGVGLYIQKYIALFQFHFLLGLILLLVIVVTAIDRISAYIRRKVT